MGHLVRLADEGWALWGMAAGKDFSICSCAGHGRPTWCGRPVLNSQGPSSVQVASAARTPSQTYIASPAASWLDDFLSWISPEIPRCCRAFPRDDSYCPPPDQPPCSVNASACANCTTCFRARGPPGPALLKQGRPTLKQVHS